MNGKSLPGKGLKGKRWNLLPRVPDKLLATDISPLMAQLAFNRGLSGRSELERFIAADDSLDGDPFLLPDMHRAVARVYRALLSGETIAIYGDFDADLARQVGAMPIPA